MSAGSYKLAVKIDGVVIYSNSFTVSLNKTGRTITIAKSSAVAYGQEVTVTATTNGFTATD